MSQTAIPCAVIRGGTSKGLYFRVEDLPADVATRDAVLLAIHSCRLTHVASLPTVF